MTGVQTCALPIFARTDHAGWGDEFDRLADRLLKSNPTTAVNQPHAQENAR